MSRKQAALAGLIGLIGGALAGLPYLDDAGACVAAGGNAIQCGMNESVGPFLSALAIGFCLVVLIGHCLAVMSRRALAPAPAHEEQERAAVEVDDALLQNAAWGQTPGADRLPKRDEQTKSAGQVSSGWAEITKQCRFAQPPVEQPHEHERPPERIGPLGARGKPVPSPHRVA